MLRSILHLLKGLGFILALSILLLFIDRNNRNSKTDRGPAKTGKQVTIALISFVQSPGTTEITEGTIEGLNDLKIDLGFDYKLDSYCASGEIQVLNNIVSAVVNKDYDYIFTTSTPTLQNIALKIKDTPVFFNFCADPVAAGAGKSFTDHQANITGISTFSDFASMANLIRKILPDLKTVGTLFNPSEVNSVIYKDNLIKEMNKVGIRVESVPAFGPTEINDASMSLVNRNIDAVCQIHDNLSETGRVSILVAARNAQIPYFGFVSNCVEEGALAAVSRDFVQAGRDAVLLLKKVISGQSISTIPFQFVSETKIMINKDVAKKLNIQIPSDLMVHTNYSLEKSKRIVKKKTVLVQYNDSPLSEAVALGISEGLKERIDEKELEFEILNAQGDLSILSSIFDAVSSKRYDLIFVSSTPTLQAAIHRIKSTPVVFCAVADPVLSGAGKSNTDHLSNITGISSKGAYMEMAEILSEIRPKIKKVGTLYTPGEYNSVINLELFTKASNQFNLELVAVPINSSTETFDATMALCSKGIDVIGQIIDNLTASSFSSIVQVANNSKMPLFGFISEQAAQGAVMVTARDYHQAGLDAVRLANRILEGESPKDIPFEIVSKTAIIINQKTADKYGIAIPEKWMKRADSIILPKIRTTG